MALSIKTKEADKLARTLSRLTGETMTEAVTKSLAERLERVKTARTGKDGDGYVERISAHTARIRATLDLSHPVTKREYDEMWGEDE
jgi:antitoxin VapB